METKGHFFERTKLFMKENKHYNPLAGATQLMEETQNSSSNSTKKNKVTVTTTLYNVKDVCVVIYLLLQN